MPPNEWCSFASRWMVSSKGETMMYRSVIAEKAGSPDVLQVVEKEFRDPAKDEVLIKVLASAVTRPDITVRQGEALYSGTPLGQKFPFVPGYAIIGDVEAVGDEVREASVEDRVGVLTVVGGYTEYLYWRSDRLIPIPKTVDPAEAVTLILNHIVAYQCLHRSAKVKEGDKILIIGASGGIGTALLQLGKVAGLELYAIASKSKHQVLLENGAVPIDYRTQDFIEFLQDTEPGGLDAVIDGMMRIDYINGGLSLLKKGGVMVSYGEPASIGALFRIIGKLASVNLMPNGLSYKLYGTSTYFLFNQQPYLDDWAKLFNLLELRQIEPVIMRKFPILEAAEANEFLESGEVVGNVVLVAPELLT